ncbi:MAG: hypothetical protein LJE68_13025 [Rhodobacter sp.]|jgi:hypothetical protein|nr:hypothetical protein [Rhodobacter sp.]
MRVLLTVLILVACPVQLWAGAWPRDKGATFLSFTHTLSAPMDAPVQNLSGYSTAYLERGLGRNLTLGFDGGMAAGGDYAAIVFLRRSLGSGQGRNAFALQGGLGLATSSGSASYVIEAGASWGRGMKTVLGAGWAALDTRLQYRPDQAGIVAKADLTLGFKPVERTKLMFQVQLGDYPDSDPYVRLAPSLAREIGPGRHIELGAQIGVVGDDRVGLKLGTWLEF